MNLVRNVPNMPNLTSNLLGDLFLIESVAANGQLRIFPVQGLPFIEELAEGLMGGLGNAPGGEVTNPPLNFRKRDLEKDDGG